MRNFFYSGLKHAAPGARVRLSKEEETHLFKILRAREGEKCILLDGCGRSALAEVAETKTVLILELREGSPLPGPALHLYLAPPRRQKTDLILKQAVELGVASITPFLSARSVSTPDADSVSGRWLDLMMEGCKQSGNPFLPACGEVVSFNEALSRAEIQAPGGCFFGSVMESERETLSRSEEPPEGIAWFVGPEGGFTPEEERRMLESAFHPLHLTSWTLRAETAAICGLAVLRDRFSVAGRAFRGKLS